MTTDQIELTENLVRDIRETADALKARIPVHACSTTRQAEAVHRLFQEGILEGVVQAADERIKAVLPEVRKRLGLPPAA